MPIPRLSATARIAFSLVGVSSSLMMLAALFGLIPDRKPIVLEERTRLCHLLTVNFATVAQLADKSAVEASFQQIVDSNEDIKSLALRDTEGELVIEIGPHAENWTLKASDHSTDSEMFIPVLADGEDWGSLEVRFSPVYPPGMLGVFSRPEFLLTSFMSLVNLVFFYFYLRIVLRHLNPSKVVPTRVRDALDSLAEGLLILDRDHRIVLANRAFVKLIRKPADKMIGTSVDAIKFVSRDEGPELDSPWKEADETNCQVLGRLLSVDQEGARDCTFSVSAAPIRDEKGESRGLLISFEDVSALENKKRELGKMVDHLHESSEQIKNQNRKLEHLATRDPLTECFNRRSFFDRFESAWSHAVEQGAPLSAVMVDIDHFKSINDNHGHSMGDLVLKRVAKCLRETVGELNLVCRYGGEEFVILLVHHDQEKATAVGERLRKAIQALDLAPLSLTASLGVSCINSDTNDPQDLLDQADKAMYVAKRNGRNRVINWSQVSTDLVVDESKVSRQGPTAESPEVSIPFHAVTALFSALAYRDQATASHSRRVADLAVAAGHDLLSRRECYTLEIAALLHDIGKVGVPDSILLKPGALTEEEWKVMRGHDRIGTEIVHASFGSPELSEIIENHHAHFGGHPACANLPVGDAIPEGSRLLAIADAYDAMVNDRVYRKARSQEAAFQELRRCSGTQFDPELVERFIQVVAELPDGDGKTSQSYSRDTALSIGMQVERLSSVLDDNNLAEIRTLADRLSQSAEKHGIEPIANKATELMKRVDEEQEMLQIMSTANDLLHLCRSTQRSLLEVGPESDRAPLST